MQDESIVADLHRLLGGELFVQQDQPVFRSIQAERGFHILGRRLFGCSEPVLRNRPPLVIGMGKQEERVRKPLVQLLELLLPIGEMLRRDLLLFSNVFRSEFLVRHPVMKLEPGFSQLSGCLLRKLDQRRSIGLRHLLLGDIPGSFDLGLIVRFGQMP